VRPRSPPAAFGRRGGPQEARTFLIDDECSLLGQPRRSRVVCAEHGRLHARPKCPAAL